MAFVYFLDSNNAGYVMRVDDGYSSTDDAGFESVSLPNTDTDYLAWASGKTVVDHDTESLLNADYGALSGSYSYWKPVAVVQPEDNETFAGNYNASNSQLTLVSTDAGANGFVVGQNYPASDSGNKGYYLIVTTAGGSYGANDKLYSDGATWLHIPFTGTSGLTSVNGDNGPNVTITPDDLDDASTSHKFATQTQLDLIAANETAIAAEKAKNAAQDATIASLNSSVGARLVSIQPGANVTVDNTDPLNPVVSVSSQNSGSGEGNPIYGLNDSMIEQEVADNGEININLGDIERIIYARIYLRAIHRTERDEHSCDMLIRRDSLTGTVTATNFIRTQTLYENELKPTLSLVESNGDLLLNVNFDDHSGSGYIDVWFDFGRGLQA